MDTHTQMQLEERMRPWAPQAATPTADQDPLDAVREVVKTLDADQLRVFLRIARLRSTNLCSGFPRAFGEPDEPQQEDVEEMRIRLEGYQVILKMLLDLINQILRALGLGKQQINVYRVLDALGDISSQELERRVAADPREAHQVEQDLARVRRAGQAALKEGDPVLGLYLKELTRQLEIEAHHARQQQVFALAARPVPAERPRC